MSVDLINSSEAFKTIMFDPDRNFSNANDLIEGDCRDQNSKKRKRRYVATEDPVTTERHQNRTISIDEFAEISSITGSFLKTANDFNTNTNSNTPKEFLIGDPTTVPGFGHGPLSISFRSTSHHQEAYSARASEMPSTIGGCMNSGGSASFGPGEYSGSTLSVASAGPVYDPLQQFLDRASSNGITGSSISNTLSDNFRHLSDTSKQNNINNANQRQGRQKRSEIMPLPISNVSNGKHLTIAPTAPSHWGTIPFDVSLHDNEEILRNIQFQQEQTMDQSNALGKRNNYTSSNSLNPLLRTLNLIPQNQALMPTNLIRSAGILPNDGPWSCTKNRAVAITGINTPPQSKAGKDPSGESSGAYNCDRGRSKTLFLPCDTDTLSEYQCILRSQIELFEATEDDIASSTKGRNKPIFFGQVGVRCIHCRSIQPEHRARGATYYPAKLGAMYQAGQTMAIRHLRDHCMRIPLHTRKRLFMLKDIKSSAGGGKKYWSEAASVLGVYESEEGGLRFRSPSSASRSCVKSRNT